MIIEVSPIIDIGRKSMHNKILSFETAETAEGTLNIEIIYIIKQTV